MERSSPSTSDNLESASDIVIQVDEKTVAAGFAFLGLTQVFALAHFEAEGERKAAPSLLLPGSQNSWETEPVRAAGASGRRPFSDGTDCTSIDVHFGDAGRAVGPRA
jgi:hypothetical protein